MSLSERWEEIRKNRQKRTALSMSSDLASKVMHEDQEIHSFLENRDVPPWFRGISAFQIECADSLLNCIRDDAQQSTSHRVRQCLIVMGLNPPISAIETKFLIGLCCGSDLAFLWFLMELHYKSPDPEYSLNEQLILSAICHLDMVTTLRELDRILPPPQPTKREIEAKKRRENENRKKLRRRLPYKSKYILPYFERQVRPVPYGKPLAIVEPEFRARVDSYKSYRDPNYIVHNEDSRWFENYNLQPGRRIANSIINKELDRIFFYNTRNTARTMKTLCEHHKILEKIEKSLEIKLKAIARENCLKYIDVAGPKREVLRNRVLEQLDKDVEMYLSKFRQMAKQTRKLILVHRIDENMCETLLQTVGSSECETPKDSLGSCLCICEEEEKKRMLAKQVVIKPASHVVRKKVKGKNKGKAKKKGAKAKKVEEIAEEKIRPEKKCKCCVNDGDFFRVFHSNESEPSSVHIGDCLREKPHQKKYCLCGSVCEDIEEKSSGQMPGFTNVGTNAGISTPTASNQFFLAPKTHMPWRFEYKKIFDLNKNECSERSLNIRRIFAEALDKEIDIMKEENKNAPINMDLAVENCARKLWTVGVLRKTKQLEDMEIATELSKKLNPKTADLLDFKRDYYDPEDKQLMHYMLETALAEIAKNKKFVLASMPEAHKLPLLKEWIYQRYGKVYTKEERYKLFALSAKIFRALDQLMSDVPVPQLTELGRNMYIDYTCRDYLIKKADYLKKKYYKRLNDAFMAQARIFWFAMQPFLCSNGPPIKTFFAYTPSRENDIFHFRIWKSNEFVRAPEAFENRKL